MKFCIILSGESDDCFRELVERIVRDTGSSILHARMAEGGFEVSGDPFEGAGWEIRRIQDPGAQVELIALMDTETGRKTIYIVDSAGTRVDHMLTEAANDGPAWG